jgi:DNA-binding GntR family transcriptional regulator
MPYQSLAPRPAAQASWEHAVPDEILVPVRERQTVHEGVYRQLRQALMTGRYDPAQRLTIPTLAASFGTSHMPVREALRRLSAEKALVQAANGSVFVPPVNLAQLDDICRARVTLEGLATELAVPRMEARDLRKLEALRLAHEEAGVEDGIYTSLARNQEFHFQIYGLSGSEVLPQLIEALWLRFGPYMRMLSHHLSPVMDTKDFRNGAEYHHAAMAAFAKGNAAAARRAIETDIAATQAMLRQLLDAASD